MPEDGIDILVEEIKEKSSVKILEGEQLSETRPGSEKSNGDGNDGSEEKDNPKEDQTTKDIHEDKNVVGDEKEESFRWTHADQNMKTYQSIFSSRPFKFNDSNCCQKEEARTGTSCSVYIQKFFVKQKTL